MALEGTIDTLREQNKTLGDIFTQGSRIEENEKDQSGLITNLIGVLTGNDLKNEEGRREQVGIFNRIYKAIKNLDIQLGTNVVDSTQGFIKKLLKAFFIFDLVALPGKIAMKFTELIKAIGKAIPKLVNLVKVGFTKFINTDFVLKIRLIFIDAIEKLRKKFPKTFKVFDRIADIFRGIAKGTKSIGKFAGAGGKGVLKVFSIIGKVFGFVVKFLFKPLTNAFALVKQVKGPMKSAMKFFEVLKPFLHPFRLLFKLILKPLAIITATIAGIRGFMKGFEEGGILGGLKEGFLAIVEDLIGGLIDLGAKGIGWVLKKLGFKELGEKFSNFSFSDMLRGIGDWFTVTLPEWVKGKIKAIKDWWAEWTAASPFGAVLDKIIDVVTWPFKKIGGFFKGAFDYVVGLFGGGEGDADKKEKEGGKGILPKIGEAFTFIGKLIAWPYKKIFSFFKGAFDYVVGLFGGGEGEEAEDGKGILPKKEGMFDAVLDIFTAIPAKIKDFFTKAKDWVMEKIGKLNPFSMFGGDDDEEKEVVERTKVVKKSRSKLDQLERGLMNSERRRLRMNTKLSREDIESNLKLRKESGQFRKRAEDILEKQAAAEKEVISKPNKIEQDAIEKLQRQNYNITHVNDRMRRGDTVFDKKTAANIIGAREDHMSRNMALMKDLTEGNSETRRRALEEIRERERQAEEQRRRRAARPSLADQIDQMYNNTSSTDNSMVINNNLGNNDSLQSINRVTMHGKVLDF
jgi:hypothetical protein